jgi:putative adhesin
MAEQRFHTPEPVELDLKVPFGDIDIETVDGDESFVSLEGDEKLIELTEVRQEGRRIVVELKGKKSFGITISIGDFSFHQGSNGLQVRARVPHGSTTNLATASADMKLRGRVRSLDVKTASGDLVVNGEIEREATVKTVSGDIRLERVGGELRVQTVSGDVTAQSVGGSIVAKSVSGDFRVESARQGHVTAQSVSGDIELGVAAGTHLDVDAGSVSGDLASEVPLGSDPGTDGTDGPMLVVRGKTVSGDFRVFRA